MAKVTSKAVFLGIATVVIVGVLFSIAALPYEVFVLSRLNSGEHSLGELLDKLYWPAMAFIWSGVFVAFLLGGYVAARQSRSSANANWIATVSILLVVVWVMDLASNHPNIIGPAIYSAIAFFAGAVGNHFGKKARIVIDSS